MIAHFSDIEESERVQSCENFFVRGCANVAGKLRQK